MIFRVFAVCFILSLPTSAFAADGKPWYWSWWPSHWADLDFEKPYLDGPKIPHNSQWNKRDWTPSDWTEQRVGGADELIADFYTAGILSDQYQDDEVPVLEVGPTFFRLSGQEQRRVLAVVDDRFQITSAQENGMFYIYHYDTRKPVGIYTAQGVQFQ